MSGPTPPSAGPETRPLAALRDLSSSRPIAAPRFVPTEPFRPLWGASGPQRQTLLAHLLRRPRPPLLRRERIDTRDGDFLDLDWLDAPADVPHVLVLHGLEGTPSSGYVRATLNEISRRGWGAVAMAWRSCSGELNRSLRSYCSGETEDPRWVCRHIRASGVRGPLFAIGFSLGANALLKLLAETGDEAPVDAAVAVSTPFDLGACARALDAPWSGGAIYRRHFLMTLRQKALGKLREHPASGLSPDAVRHARTFHAFDDAFTGPSNGYRDADDYYARASSGPHLGQIRRPVLCISAEDDPMIPVQTLPVTVAGPWVQILRTARGGHVGFLAGSLVRPRFWAEAQAVEFLARRLVS